MVGIAAFISSLIISEHCRWLPEMTNYFALFVHLIPCLRGSAKTSGKYNEFCSELVMEQQKSLVLTDLGSREGHNDLLHS